MSNFLTMCLSPDLWLGMKPTWEHSHKWWKRSDDEEASGQAAGGRLWGFSRDQRGQPWGLWGQSSEDRRVGLGKLVGLEQVLQKGLCLNTTKEVGEGKGTQWGLVLASRGIPSGVKTTTTSTGNRSLLSPPQLPRVPPVLTAHVLILLPSMPCRSWQIPTKPLGSNHLIYLFSFFSIIFQRNL